MTLQFIPQLGSIVKIKKYQRWEGKIQVFLPTGEPRHLVKYLDNPVDMGEVAVGFAYRNFYTLNNKDEEYDELFI